MLEQFAYASYNSSYYQSDIGAEIVAILMTYLTVFIFAVVAYVVVSLLTARIFKKAGLDAWKAWVPFYNNWKFLELGGYNGVLSLLYFVPYIGVIALFVAMGLAANEISKKLGKDTAFSLLYWFGLLSFGITTLIWYIMVVNSNSQWDDIAGKPSLAEGTILGYAKIEDDAETNETATDNTKTEEPVAEGEKAEEAEAPKEEATESEEEK